ncbi:MAG: hypothetical protein MJ146_01155 [Clostridia bacterium]|nr:hypothetical protein [Clostridia bacterium]
MPLIVLGIIFIAAVGIYYYVNSKPGAVHRKQEVQKKKEDGNVIFLPTDIEQAKKDYKKDK